MTRTDTAAELDFHASGFIVKVQGSWTDGALQQFRHFLNLRGIFPSDDELLGALQGAKAKYLAGAAHLFVCTAEPCRGKISFDASDAGLARACQQTGVAISTTGCQGPCKQAPVVSLRIGERSEVLAEIASQTIGARFSTSQSAPGRPTRCSSTPARPNSFALTRFTITANRALA